jgi:hypothetical protein
MNDEIIDVTAQEVVEPLTPFLDKSMVNQKELRKVIKQYKRYRKSTLSEIRRLDGAPQYDNPF